MKLLHPLIIAAGVLCLAATPTFTRSASAQTTPPAGTVVTEARPSEYPVGRSVVVTVDPQDSSSPVNAGAANIDTGFDAPNTVRGKLVEEKEHWLIVRDGIYEKWIPKSKILLMTFYN